MMKILSKCTYLTKISFLHHQNLTPCQYVSRFLLKLPFSHQTTADTGYKILFYGNDSFSVRSLERLNEKLTEEKCQLIELIHVVTRSRERGIETPVRQYAKNNSLQVFDWPYEVETAKYDLGIVVSFGHLIPKKVIDSFPMGMLNVHASLLPRWRGGAPIMHCILQGDAETGVTIMRIAPHRFDIGDILLQRKIAVPPTITNKELNAQLAEMGANLLVQSLEELQFHLLNPIAQDESKATYAKKVTASMAQINWENFTCLQIDRMFRAFDDTFQLRSQWKDKPVKLQEMVSNDLVSKLDICKLIRLREEQAVKDWLIEAAKTAKRGDGDLPELNLIYPGCIYFHKKRKILCVRCKDGWVGFKKVHVAGKKKMSATGFYNGYLSKVETKEWKFDYHALAAEDKPVLSENSEIVDIKS